MDFPGFEGSKEFKTVETIYQSDRRHVPSVIINTPAVT